jgi:hypothetical protein
VKEEPAASGSTAPADPNTIASPSGVPQVNGTSTVTAPTLDVPMSEVHAEHGPVNKEHEAHPHDETHAHVNGTDFHGHSTPELSGHHDAHLLGITDKALIDAVNLLNESAQDITLESGSIHPVSTPSSTSVPSTPAAPSTTATDPAHTTSTVAASNNNAAPTSTTPAQPSTAAPQAAAQPNGAAVAPGTNPATGEVKEKKKVFNRLWTPEEQRKLERLLEEYPEEIIASHRWEKIARALGNRSPKQVSLVHHSIARMTGVKMSF